MTANEVSKASPGEPDTTRPAPGLEQAMRRAEGALILHGDESPKWRLRAALASLAADGFVLVPREATEDMLRAGESNLVDQYGANDHWENAKDVAECAEVRAIFNAMLAAAPKPGGAQGGGA